MESDSFNETLFKTCLVLFGQIISKESIVFLFPNPKCMIGYDDD